MNPSYQTEATPHGIRFTLPTRDLQSIRHFGWILVAVGLPGVIFMLFWISFPLLSAVQMLGQQNWIGVFLLGFAALGLIGFYHTAKILMMGIFVVLNRTRCTVEIKGDRLISNEQLGWFEWRRSCEIDKIEKLELRRALDYESDGDDNVKTSLAHFADADLLGIVAVGPRRNGFTIAPAYPRQIVESLVSDLAKQLDRERVGRPSARPVQLPADSRVTNSQMAGFLPVVDLSSDEAVSSRQFQQPENSQVQLHDRDGRLAFEVPPAGIWKGSKGLFLFSICWLVIVGFVTIGMVTDLVQNPQNFWETLGWLAFLSIFLLIGVSTLLIAINMGQRSVMIGILDDQLFIERKSIFKTKWLEFSRDQIKHIRMGRSGMEVNDRPVMELQIHTADGKKQGLLSQLTDDDLKWLAAELQNALSIKQDDRTDHWTDSIDSVTGQVVRPESTKIRVDETHQQTQITVPPLGAAKFVNGVLVAGLCLVVAGVGIAIIFGFDLLLVAVAASLFLVGASMIVGRAIFVTRRFDIVASDTKLLITRRDCCGSKASEIDPHDIQWIDVKRSGTRINEVDIMQLTISTKSKQKHHLLFGRPTDEIAFVAALLNRRLAVANSMGPDKSGEKPDLVSTSA